jgi:predicted PurR-regulated permease PerM
MVAIAPEIRSRTTEATAGADEREARTAAENWQIIANVSTAGLFALAILAALYLMKDVVVPVILAWVVANILSPVVAWLEKRKFKRGTAVALVTVAMLSLLAIIVLLLSLPLTYWVARPTRRS